MSAVPFGGSALLRAQSASRRAQALCNAAVATREATRQTRHEAIWMRQKVRSTRRVRIGHIYALDVDHAGDRTRILIVDDNEAFCESTTEILQIAGYEAVGVSDPDEALPVLAQGGVALVLLDVGLDFGGLRLLPHVEKPTKVIFMSGSPDRRQAPRVGPLLLTKPVIPQRLLNEVESHLHSER
jgi:CheY-like chemotaxis protein